MTAVATGYKIGYYLKEQWIAISWTSRCSAFLSIVGSSTIIFMILRRRKVRLALVHNRIIFAMSIIDIFFSATFAIGPLAAPAEENGITVYGARGSDTTCTIQGFVFSVGLSCPLYNACLCLVYLSVIRYNTPDDVLMKRAKFMHIYSLGVGLSIGIYGLVTDTFTTAGAATCWYHPQEEKIVKKLALFFSALSALVIVGSMFLIYMTVRKQSQIMKKYEKFNRTSNGSGDNDADIEHRGENHSSQRHEQQNLGAQKETAQQAYLFVGAWLSTYAFSIIDNMFIPERNFAIMILISIFYPLQVSYELVLRGLLRKYLRYVYAIICFDR